MHFLVLAIFFGSVLMIDKAKQNSPRTKRKIAEAEAEAKRKTDEAVKRAEEYAKKYVEAWEKTGLPPSQWK